MTMQLAHSHPHLQLKLQDLPNRVTQAQNEIWPKECPEALKEGRIEFKALDFFAESPIRGCDIYYVRLAHPVIMGVQLMFLTRYSSRASCT